MGNHDDDRIAAVARNYLKYSLWLVVALALIGLMAANVMFQTSWVMPVTIAALFSLATSIAYGMAWRSVARSAPQTLTKFYLAASALRMLCAAMVVAVYCVAVRQPQQIREFVIVFFVFYIATLIFDSVFFARIEKQNKTY